MTKIKILILLAFSPIVMGANVNTINVGELELAYCHITGHAQEVLCGEYTVYEDRASGQGRQIDILFAVVPATAIDKEADPLVFFAGGPGQGARDLGAFVNMALREIHENRDIVLIDQRGMGSSHPLKCEQESDEFLMLTDAELAQRNREVLQQCLLELDADTTKYTQDLANEDIHDILQALGYDQVNLYGGSWGTRSALLYNYQFPEHVRSVILDGNAPFENKVPLYANADAQSALQALFDDCANTESCSKVYPTLAQDFAQVLDSFGETGIEVTTTEATSGEQITFLLSRRTFANAIRGILYSAQVSRMIPIIVEQAKNQDFRALMGVTAALSGDTNIAVGAQLSVLCAEDFPRMTSQEIAVENERGFVGDAFIDVFTNGCGVWPSGPLPEIYSQDLSSNVPTLIMSGVIDPVTPVRWGEIVAQMMGNSLHLIAPNTGHNVAPVGCAPDLMAEFVNQASVVGIDGSCLDEIKRPSFFLNLSGPTPLSDSSTD